MLHACIQCGTCTGSCPNAFAMDRTPRHLWRMVLMGYRSEIFKTRTFELCSSCYTCTLRCPRGLPLTEAMARLKQIAAQESQHQESNYQYRKSTLFYKKFIESVRRHGRVREVEFMTLYFVSMKNPFIPLRFGPLGIKLMRKGKITFQMPYKGEHPLESIFRKVEEIENSQV
ncbi:MAG: 4Fe-4S dicluster domain-containing protein [Desulfamplus sp.]|nr:4Fe-4S dicluster domain-containing protein [Desulfamplus sp.]